MSSEIAISVKNLTKTYRIFGHPGDRIKQALTFGKKRFHKEFTALRDVSFEIKKGETVGIIGRNGSGKSTLLQLICGILKPTHGSVNVNGRVSALLELGAGFNPEFTGRENVYFQGAIMGLTATQIDERFEEIVTFADIGEFIEQPVRTYSSGMYVRLAFAVAIHVSPDILVIDEALAVGDTAFQAKCISALNSFHERGITILIVSHEINAIKSLCKTVIFLDRGQLGKIGNSSEVTEYYLHQMRLEILHTKESHLANRTIADTDSSMSESNEYTEDSLISRQGSGEARITRVELLDESGHSLEVASFGQRVSIRLHIRFSQTCRIAAAYYLRDDKGALLVGSSTLLEGWEMIGGSAGEQKIVEFDTNLPLMDGVYGMLVLLSSPIIPNHSAHFMDYVENALVFSVKQRDPLKLWSKLYLKNDLTVRDV